MQKKPYNRSQLRKCEGRGHAQRGVHGLSSHGVGLHGADMHGVGVQLMCVHNVGAQGAAVHRVKTLTGTLTDRPLTYRYCLNL
jgi:hypothetical protein